jgi:hypothetical protein
MTVKSTVLVLDLHRAFMESAEFEWAEEDVPDAIIDFLEADVFSDANSGDIDPTGVPAAAADGRPREQARASACR